MTEALNNPSGDGFVDRRREERTRRFLRDQQTLATWLPGWRTQRRRRALVVGLTVSFVAMFAVAILYAFGVQNVALFTLPACLAFFPLWIALQVVSGRRADAPRGVLDEPARARRDSARSFGLTVTQQLMLLPVGYLIVGALLTSGTDENMAFAGGLMVLTVILVGTCVPAMVLGWKQPADDSGSE